MQEARPFDDRYIPEPMSGCFLWLDFIDRGGYGIVEHRGKKYKAQRFSWMLHRGEITKGLCVLHKCDVRSCVNPDHLFLGTIGDNNYDRAQKRRNANTCGIKHNMARLTEADVLAIRSDTRLQRVIAEDYDLTQSTVSQIKHRVRWKHI
jgi:hypothetical protein